MKARRLVPGKDRHPEYTAAARSSKKYTGPKFLHYPAGHVIDHPDAWRLCVGGSPVAVPADDECADKVLAQMTSPARQRFLAEIKNMLSPAIMQQLSKGEQERVRHLAQVYADELTAPDVDDSEFESVDA